MSIVSDPPSPNSGVLPDRLDHPAAEPANVSAAMRWWGLLRAARPHQWTKNLVCLAGLIFSGRLFLVEPLRAALIAFACFCLASSGCYLINDLCDLRADRQHPKKRLRPLAAGVVPPSWAAIAAGILIVAALGLSSLALPLLCTIVLVIYLVQTAVYSVWLKHTVLLDVLVIALGFVLRVLFGVFAVGVRPTAWIVLCMFFLALFLGFAKRRSELNQVSAEGPGGAVTPRRPVLAKYRIDLLDLMLGMTATMAICFYALYTVIGRPDHDSLVLTVPLVFYGIARFMVVVMRFNVGDAPERQLFSDRVSLLIAVAWALLCVIILYTDVQIFARVEMLPK